MGHVFPTKEGVKNDGEKNHDAGYNKKKKSNNFMSPAAKDTIYKSSGQNALAKTNDFSQDSRQKQYQRGGFVKHEQAKSGFFFTDAGIVILYSTFNGRKRG